MFKRLLFKISVFFVVSFLSFPLSVSAKSLEYPAIDQALNFGLGVYTYYGVMGIYYYMKQNYFSSVSDTGTVSRPSQAVWIDSKDLQVKTKDISAKIAQDKVKSISSSKPSAYPKLKAATVVKNAGSTVNSGLAVNAKYRASDGNIYVVTSSGSGVYAVGYDHYPQDVSGVPVWSSSTGSAAIYHADWGLIHSYACGAASNGMVNVCYQSVRAATSAELALIPDRAATSSEFKQSVAPTGTVTDSAYQAELDAMLKDPDYVPTFTDDTTGLPYASPAQSDVMTPAQVAAYNKTEAARVAAQAAATSAAQAATNAGTAYTNSGGDLSTGTGGDQGLYQKYLDAKAASDAAAAKSAELDSNKTDSSSYSGAFDNSTPYGDQSKDFNFGARFRTFFDAMKSTALFSLPNQFLGNIPSSSTSSMTIEGGRFGQFSYDFAQFNSVFLVVKSILLVLFSWVSARIVMLKGGGG